MFRVSNWAYLQLSVLAIMVTGCQVEHGPVTTTAVDPISDTMATDPPVESAARLAPGRYTGTVTVAQSADSTATANGPTTTDRRDKSVRIGESGVPLWPDGVPMEVGQTADGSIGSDGRLASVLTGVNAIDSGLEITFDDRSAIRRNGQVIEMFGATSIRYVRVDAQTVDYEEIASLSGRDFFGRPFAITRHVTGTLTRDTEPVNNPALVSE